MKLEGIQAVEPSFNLTKTKKTYRGDKKPTKSWPAWDSSLWTKFESPRPWLIVPFSTFVRDEEKGESFSIFKKMLIQSEIRNH